MAKHRAFNADRYLDKFQGNEIQLDNYLDLWGDRLQRPPAPVDIPAFKDFILNGGGSAKDEFMEGLYRANDISNERGHEDVVAACQAQREPYDPDPEGKLPVECLSLKVRTENDEAFNLAYDRSALFQAERFAVFQGTAGQAIADAPAAAERLRAKLAADFKGEKKSELVLVRQYQEGAYANFIVYHEKRTQAKLIFNGTRVTPKVSPMVLRPAQQDYISYDNETGQVEIEARFESETATMRKAFAGCCLGDPDIFERPEACQKFSLGVIACDDFELEVDSGDAAALVELQFRLKQQHSPTFVVRSADVLDTLRMNYVHSKLAAGAIQKAIFKIHFCGDRRPKRVELSGVNRIAFKRATRAEEVFRYLRRWKILNA